MRDVIWTIIVIWVVWKAYNAIKRTSHSRNVDNSKDYVRNEGEIRIDKNSNKKSHFNSQDGEYVDYEEVK